MLATIRRLVGLNLVIGLSTIATAVLGEQLAYRNTLYRFFGQQPEIGSTGFSGKIKNCVTSF